MTKKTLIILSILLTLCINFTPKIVKAQESIKLGWVGPLTGPLSNLGSSAKDGVALALKNINDSGGINGQRVKIVTMDTQFKVVQTIEVMQRLIYAQKVDAIIGSLSSAGSLASMEILKKSKIPLLSCGIIALEPQEKENPFVIQISGNESDLTNAIADFAIKSLNLKRFAVLSPDNYIGRFRRTIFRKQLLKFGTGEIVTDETYPINSSDFVPYLFKIRKTHPDAIMLMGFSHDSALIAKQAKEIGIKSQIIGTGLEQSDKVFSMIGGNSVDNLIAPTFYCPKAYSYRKIVEFAETWKKERGEEPNFTAANAYDAVVLLVEAIKNVGTDGKEIAKALKTPREYKGVSGIIKFIKGGGIKNSIVIGMWIKGKFIPKKTYF